MSVMFSQKRDFVYGFTKSDRIVQEKRRLHKDKLYVRKTHIEQVSESAKDANLNVQPLGQVTILGFLCQNFVYSSIIVQRGWRDGSAHDL